MARCSMCWLEREKQRPVLQNHPVRVCGQCSLMIDKVQGFLEGIGVEFIARWGDPAPETDISGKPENGPEKGRGKGLQHPGGNGGD